MEDRLTEANLNSPVQVRPKAVTILAWFHIAGFLIGTIFLPLIVFDAPPEDDNFGGNFFPPSSYTEDVIRWILFSAICGLIAYGFMFRKNWGRRLFIIVLPIDLLFDLVRHGLFWSYTIDLLIYIVIAIILMRHNVVKYFTARENPYNSGAEITWKQLRNEIRFSVGLKGISIFFYLLSMPILPIMTIFLPLAVYDNEDVLWALIIYLTAIVLTVLATVAWPRNKWFAVLGWANMISGGCIAIIVVPIIFLGFGNNLVVDGYFDSPANAGIGFTFIALLYLMQFGIGLGWYLWQRIKDRRLISYEDTSENLDKN